MWPWEHLAVGYLAFSVWCRIAVHSGPDTTDVFAVALGTQFPDLVDKPLAWGFDVLASGTSLAHSLLVAVPVAVAAVLTARHYDRNSVGVAFALGYLLHLPADAVYGGLVGGSFNVNFLLWPLVPLHPAPPTPFFARATELFVEFVALLHTPVGYRYLVIESALVGTALAAWLLDGRPGLPPFSRQHYPR
jgi:hypothetical protein